MKTEVKIAELKSKLSEYLRSVRRGNEVVIKDRETPIARLVPYEERAQRPRLTIRPAQGSLKEVDRILANLPRPKGLKPGDADRALQWVRRDRFENGPV
ncbi:MAG TPA: type II toxin-antitoxin system prevent-host-death family antitoxin [Bryobacteraceae bacterium]|nr:type II toxin-antitoxin system prevent-host-death family antitoxin [Bryobacteraceae bacterium]